MTARTLTRFGWCALLAALAGGCRTADAPRPKPPEPSARARQPDNEPGEPPFVAPLQGTVVGASGQLPAIPVAPQPQPQPMPQPRFPATGLPLNQPRPLPMQIPLPGAPGAPGSGFADPNFRAWPTVSGARWDLAPNELALDRLVEITKYLDAALAQNRELLARVRELETLGKTREQALAEAAREVDSLAVGAKERAALLAQIEELRARVKQIEDEDIKLFEVILKFLNQQFPEKKP